MPTDCKYSFLAADSSLGDFLDAFERGTWPKPRWNHAAHLSVGTSYLLAYGYSEAVDRMRNGIRHYNECVGTVNSHDSGYHETLTIFWLRILKSRLEKLPRELPRLEIVRTIIEELAPQRDLYREYYAFDVVRSHEARRTWVPPDLKVLE